MRTAIRRYISRKVGYNLEASFFETEALDAKKFNREFARRTSEQPKDSALEAYLMLRLEQMEQEISSSKARAQNFLLVANSGALAGLFALYAPKGLENLSIWNSLPLVLFFLSVVFLGATKWSQIVRAHFINGEFHKALIRYFAGSIDSFQLVQIEYAAIKKPTTAGLWAILSFVFFIIGWILLCYFALRYSGQVGFPSFLGYSAFA